MRGGFVLLALLLLVPGGSEGLSAQDTTDQSSLSASLITVGPGAAFWERFGHNAIWIHDPSAPPAQRDIAYDYGRFDFNAEHFFLKAATGDMQYSMDSATVNRIVRGYAARDRSVSIQRLNLTGSQVRNLQRHFQDDIAKVRSPSGWTYRYDYYLDNCSTRLRDALDVVLGGQLRSTMASQSTGTTYRFHSLRSVANNLLTLLGIDMMLGPAADRPVSQWETAFLPSELQRAVQQITVIDSLGAVVPLVLSTIPVAPATRYFVPDAPPPWRSRSFLAGAGVALVGLILARGTAGGRRGTVWRRGLGASLIGAWVLTTAIAGVVLTLLWTISTHRIAYFNANLFYGNLLSVLVLGWYPSALRGAARGVRIVRTLVTLSAALAVLGMLLSLTGIIPQVVGPFGWVAVPVWIGLAVATRWIFPVPPPSPVG